MLILRGTRGPHAHAIFVIERTTTFGRASGVAVQVLDQRVSRQHARLSLDGGRAVLHDLRSRNGTFIGGQRIDNRPLQHGDRIQIGVAEYAFEEVRGALTTSPLYLKKLTTRETLGATIVRKVAEEILNSPTAEMPLPDDPQAVATVGIGPDDRAPPRVPLVAAEERPAGASAGAELDPLSLELDEVEEPPPPPPFGVAESQAPVQRELSRDDTPPRLTRELPFAPRAPTLLDEHNNEAAVETIPVGPRTAPRTEPRAPTRSSPEPAPVEEKQGPGEAQTAVDAVMRLLNLRVREEGGAALRVNERANLRKLERALRGGRRGPSNRRRWVRLPCSLAARVAQPQSGSGSDAVLTDIGAGGLRIDDSSLPLVPGDQVTIKIQLDGGRLGRLVVFESKVVWVDAVQGSFGAVFAGGARWELTG